MDSQPRFKTKRKLIDNKPSKRAAKQPFGMMVFCWRSTKTILAVVFSQKSEFWPLTWLETIFKIYLLIFKPSKKATSQARDLKRDGLSPGIVANTVSPRSKVKGTAPIFSAKIFVFDWLNWKKKKKKNKWSDLTQDNNYLCRNRIIRIKIIYSLPNSGLLAWNVLALGCQRSN